ncbi:hypothetical protein ANT2_1267 [plant metagenome]|uniref:Uncharacterized protein n=1 Tax=plant metagenome TaxID=1297885 RepID=A0A484RA34_9ZZZZ
MRRIHPGAFILRCNPHHQRKKDFPGASNRAIICQRNYSNPRFF